MKNSTVDTLASSGAIQKEYISISMSILSKKNGGCKENDKNHS